jgi:hypothetical protein
MTTTLSDPTISGRTTRTASGGRRIWRTGAVAGVAAAVLIPALASRLSD